MQYIKGTLDFHITEPAVVTLGKFDGLHLGHKYLLQELEKGKKNGLKTVIFTFDIPPKSIHQNTYKVLSTNKEKEQIFENAGIDYVIECPFTDAFKHLDPRSFLLMLREKICVKQIVAGKDFRFGCNRSGSYVDLIRYEQELCYHAVIVDKIQYEGEDISSTRIRDLIHRGDLKTANYLLGYDYFLTAPVLHGNEIGRTLGFPTVNQLPDSEKLLPPNGVYASRIRIGDQLYAGISNIGCKPTIAGTYPVGVETNIFDFHENIYDKEIQVSFLEFIRPEQKFASLDALREQIDRDRENVRKFFRSRD